MYIVFSGNVISVIFSLLLLLFFLYFIFCAVMHSIRRKAHLSYAHRLIAIVSVSAILLVLSDIAYYKSVTEMLVYEVAIAMFPMIVGMKTDVTWEEIRPYGFSLFGFSLAVVLLRLTVPSGIRLLALFRSTVSCLMVGTLIAILYRNFFKMISDKGHVLRASSVKARVRNELDTLYVLGILSIFVVQLSSTGEYPIWGRMVFLICLISILLMFFCCHRRITSDCLIVFSHKRDDELKGMIDLCVNEIKENMKIDHNYRAIYERVLVCFENDKPYLDPDLNVDDVAKMTFCNRLYVSRAISMFSGRNFCQYVNYYRIRHAVRIFEDDKELKLQQWAELAGFKTVACFSMAFKLYMNESPGDWSRRLKGVVPRQRSKKMLIDR